MSHLTFNNQQLRHASLEERFGNKIAQLPVVLRHLLENVLRCTTANEQATSIEAIFDWLNTGNSDAEIPFLPGRLLMHDTTSTPALVDIAGMRDALAEAGVDPEILNPVVPVDVSVDHSLAVEAFARPDATETNARFEIHRNQERFRFMQWASKTFNGVKIHPPGTGIMHTINLEQLATVVTTQEIDGEQWAVPDMMLGTDSHTPMVNGIGVLGWGVGGLEAQTVMFGMPTMLKIPDVVGVQLMGQLPSGTQGTDLALALTHELRKIGVTGEFVEFFGPGVSTLSVGTRSTIANMAPEYGATTGFFPVDEQTLTYLRTTGRPDEQLDFIRAFCQANALWFDPEATPRYSRTITVDLSKISIHVAGPKRPQDLLAIEDIPQVLERTGFKPASQGQLPAFPIAIAAITSCTNTTDPALLIAAGLLARKAHNKGLKVSQWVKTSLAPGSPASAIYLKRCGLDKDLAAVGFDIVGYGCSTCIGNSGQLIDSVSQAQAAVQSKAVAAISGNRNFPGRIHPDVEYGFLMSPALVVAFALAGDASRNLNEQPVGYDANGDGVWLKELMPSHEEVESTLKLALNPLDFSQAFKEASKAPLWYALESTNSPRFPWDEHSTILRRPPFASLSEGSQLGLFSAFPLMVLGDDVTTDHISPASAIPKESLVADFLVAHGDDRNDLNVFASRRGNWEVMMRGAFYSKAVHNLLQEGLPLGHTLHVPSGKVMPIWEAADKYKSQNSPVIIVAGDRYGMGSSRDWAAKGQRLLGVHAVIATSFERIHRSNLIGMGILPIRLLGSHPNKLNIQPGDRFEIDASPELIAPRVAIRVTLNRRNGTSEDLIAIADVETNLEVQVLRNGGVIPTILKKQLNVVPTNIH